MNEYHVKWRLAASDKTAEHYVRNERRSEALDFACRPRQLGVEPQQVVPGGPRRLIGVLAFSYHVADANCSDAASRTIRRSVGPSSDRHGRRPIRAVQFG